MDKTYIKMCEKAEEIQQIWNPQYGDWYYGGIYNKAKVIVVMRRYRKHSSANFLNNKQNIWLPRQDQLQEMVLDPTIIEGDYYPIPRMLHEFYLWLKDCRYPNVSMEQLWLAFVMYEKYQKKWDSEKEEWEICT